MGPSMREEDALLYYVYSEANLPAAINIVCQRRALVVGEVVVIAIAMLASGWRSHRAMPHRRHLPRLLLACPS